LYATSSRTYWSILPASSAKYDPCETQRGIDTLEHTHGLERTNAPWVHRRHDAKSRRVHVSCAGGVRLADAFVYRCKCVGSQDAHSVSDKCSQFRDWGPGKRHLRLRRLCLLTLQQTVRSCPAVQSTGPILPSTASQHYTEYTCSLSCVWYTASGTASRRGKT